MILVSHPTARCPDCDEVLHFGSKEEATSWNVYYICFECCWERVAGRMSRSDVDHLDELNEQAEEMGERWT